ncbi:maleylacetate reductase [Modestobacter versicolor]|uniref:maleylacetate reductase n=1 Tax=Modestobacter versicolor TaxID=429133 RepID=UPI0034DE6F22
MSSADPVLERFAAGRSFVAAPVPRVVFGPGAVDQLPAEVGRLGWSRVLVLSTPGQRRLGERVAGLLGDRAAGVHAGAVQHVPVGSIAAAVAALRGADACLAVGGGSTIGLAKAVARDAGVPYLAVPTTYSGSEMTPVWGVTSDGVKTTGRSDAVRASTVVYDPQLTTGLPVATSVTSGLNAVAHAAEALYAPDATPLTDAMAASATEAMLAALPRLVEDPADAAARGAALTAAWLCGCCLAATTMALHHKLCHTLGGAFGLPHAETHAALFPYSLAFNLPAAPFAHRTLAAALSSDAPATALWQLARRLGAPTALAALGLSAADVPEIVATVLGSPYANPRPLTGDRLTALLEAAVAGVDPAALAAG